MERRLIYKFDSHTHTHWIQPICEANAELIINSIEIDFSLSTNAISHLDIEIDIEELYTEQAEATHTEFKNESSKN